MKRGSYFQLGEGIWMSYRFYGALGFGLGGIIVGLSGDFMIFAFFLMGVLGSAFLTIPAHDLGLTLRSSILGGTGLFVGFMFPLFVFITIYEPSLPPFFYGLIMGIIIGLIEGLLLGIAFRSIKYFMILGTIGFGISLGLGMGLREVLRPIFPAFFIIIVMVIAGGIGGLFLGQAASLAKNKNIKS